MEDLSFYWEKSEKALQRRLSFLLVLELKGEVFLGRGRKDISGRKYIMCRGKGAGFIMLKSDKTLAMSLVGKHKDRYWKMGFCEIQLGRCILVFWKKHNSLATVLKWSENTSYIETNQKVCHS